MAVNSGEIKTIRKGFSPWQDDLEEAWLSNMASKGWHFTSFTGINKYNFVKGKPKKVSYCLDYHNLISDMENYKKIFEDAGWEYLGNLKSWQYFRKEYTGDTPPEIFTDSDSKIQKYNKLVALYSFIAIILGNLYIWLFSGIVFKGSSDFIDSYNSNILDFLHGFFSAIIPGGVLAFIFLTFCVINKINEIKKLS
ncbi:DUF2812 domain-containing protein [Oceanirhabdus sp. W0125-5]|uniref:DUF2812 domain-containing protein n=1 Tax=Oceanirhabdus sp. W0125-5 TaxID=2999116 RepID=UPI0022F2FEE7|nr:DUF2812 domain-containing protein [Oceanirhabdus sp. W0125-5]WBW97638.1 DUF2812 domain-containing protein [Oceanirhabdus sp. W0125-5]